MTNSPLKRSARAVAPVPETVPTPGKPVVPVRIGETTYGVPVEAALEAVVLGPLTPVPLAPPRLKGAHALRGRPSFVIDCGAKVGATMGLTVEHAGHLYTLVVDELGEVETADLPPLDIAKLVEP